MSGWRRCKSCCVVAVVGWFCIGAVIAEPTGRLVFLGVAYDDDPPKRETSSHYDAAPDNFMRLFRDQSAELFTEFHAASLKGDDVTRAGVEAALATWRRSTRPGDVAFLYWGSHGSTGRKGWVASLADGGRIYGSDIKAALAGFPCPVVCVFCTCGSGGLVEYDDGVPLPENVTVICACRAKQSTTNELDRALCEALTGFGDADGSGDVTLREALAYVRKRYGLWFAGRPEKKALAPVIGGEESTVVDRPLTRVTGTHAAIVHEDEWYGVNVLSRTNSGVSIRFLGYDSTRRKGPYARPVTVVCSDTLTLPGDEPPIEVLWQGTWYPARVLSRSDEGWLIHYIGYPDCDDEVVPPHRVRYPLQEPRQVQ